MSDAKVKDLEGYGAGAIATGTIYTNSTDVSKYREIIAMADVDAVTTTLDITMQVSTDDSFFVDHDAFTQLSGAGEVEKRFTNFSRYVRFKLAVVGGATLGTNGIVATAKT